MPRQYKPICIRSLSCKLNLACKYAVYMFIKYVYIPGDDKKYLLVLYVGMTGNINQRLRNHPMPKKDDWDHIKVFPFETKQEAIDEEARLIDKFKPKHNKRAGSSKKLRDTIPGAIIMTKKKAPPQTFTIHDKKGKELYENEKIAAKMRGQLTKESGINLSDLEDKKNWKKAREYFLTKYKIDIGTSSNGQAVKKKHEILTKLAKATKNFVVGELTYKATETEAETEAETEVKVKTAGTDKTKALMLRMLTHAQADLKSRQAAIEDLKIDIERYEEKEIEYLLGLV